jgi:hypothetical protein
MTPERTGDTDRPGGVRLVAGALVAASRWREAPGEPGSGGEQAGPDLRYMALGVLCVTEDRIRGVARAAAGVTRAVGAPVVGVALPLVPAPLRRSAASVMRALDEHGRTASAAGTDEVGRLAEALSEIAGRDPNVLRLVEEIVDQIQWRVVDTILPVVLERLAAEPEQVRAIVQGQSRGMVDELTTTVRSRAETGDEAVDRLVARLLHRRPTRPDAAAGDEPERAPTAGGARPPEV